MGTGTVDLLTDIPHETVVAGCGCAICQGMRDGVDKTQSGVTDANPEGNNIGTLLTLVTNPDGSRSFTGNRNVDATLIGSKWGTQNLTYSFPLTGSNYNGNGYDSNGVSLYHIDLGGLQQAAARASFAQISAATNLTFREIVETDTEHANIRISQSADQDVGSAYGGFPSDTRGVAGDIWFGRTNQPFYDLSVKGTWGYSTMMHEIGHTMGLKHGHQDYTNSDLSFYFGTAPRFGTQSLTPDRDGQAWSLMTYTPAPGTSGFAGEKVNQPQTYMQYDLAALQYMYGANYTTNASDTTYTFSQTTGEMFVNGISQGIPSGNKIFLTIWDGGGNDTIDASNYANGVTIDLRPGEYSTVDQAQLANSLAYQNGVALAPGNIAMSLLYNNDARSLIENAKGGAGNDVFVGNMANNILDGGAGSDTVVFTNTTGVTVTLNDTGADVVVTHDGETDILRSIENIQGTAGNDVLTGNSQNNTLSGGRSGSDVLSGGAGDDRLIGGGFTVVNNALITKAQSDSNLSIATAINPQARNAYTLTSDANVTSSTTLPHATINATATGGGLEYYRVDATAGSSAIFDIDFSSIDTWIELVDAAGTILASNDDNGNDPGSSATNSLIGYTFATAGTYYLRVGRWTANEDAQAQPLAAGTTYTLHISLSSAAVNSSPFSAINNSSAVLDGGEGNDLLQGTLGNDTIAGGAGTDTASFATAFSNTATGVMVDLALQGTAQNTGAAGSDTLSGIENLVGSSYNDTLLGDAGANVIEGGGGNDTLVGGAGDDTASYAGAAAGVNVSLGLQGQAQNTGAAGNDTLSGFQNLLGSAFNDTLTGDAGENVLTGGAGDDTLATGGNAAGTVDLLDGGTGSDTASFAGYTTGVTATLRGSADGSAAIGGAAIAALRGIENLVGGTGSDMLTGDAGDNVLEGGLGDDMLDGGAGSDTASFVGTTAVTLDLRVTTAQATGAGNDTLVNIENVRTGSGNDTITGSASDNVFYEGGGNDSYNGSGGVDTIDYSRVSGSVTVNLNLTTAQNTVGTGGTDTITDIENVVGAAFGVNTLTGGNTSANRLTGGASNDYLIGGGLNDVLIGGAGSDVLFGDYVNTFSTGATNADGDDVLEGGASNDSLVGGMGNDILRGGDGDDTLIGGIANGSSAGVSTIYTNDGGDDVYDGGEGSDTAYAYYTDRAAGISFNLANVAGNSAILVDGVARGSFTSIERVIFRGGTGNDNVVGTAGVDTLLGNQGDDVLDGWYGNDVLLGGLGNDTLNGGEGLDTASFVNATAGVTVDLRIAGQAQDTGEGLDTFNGIEYLTGSGFGDTLRGNDDFNLIVDNAVAATTALSQTDALYGYGGNDSILVTRAANSVATTIVMDGGDGSDFIELRSGTLIGGGLASLGNGLSTATYLALGAVSTDRNLDVVNVDGGAGDDRIVLSGVARATIDAGSGNDFVSISMRGAAGVNNHRITLGSGADTIQLGIGGLVAEATSTFRQNVVTDFERGDSGDRFELTTYLNQGLTNYTANSNAFTSGHLRLFQSGTSLELQVDRDGTTGTANGFVTIFSLANAYTGGLTAFNFDGFIGNLSLSGFAGDETITGATGSDILSGGGGNDVLIGLAGNDMLMGDDGDDVLIGGAGDDRLFGGAGSDTASYADAAVGVTVSLAIAGAQATGDGSDTLEGIENLIGSRFNDILTGDAGANRLEGGAGSDRLDGGEGDDTVSYAGAMAGVTVNLMQGSTIKTAGGADILIGIENVVGSAFGDTLTGGAGRNYIEAGAGDDTVSGGLGDDMLFGGDGFDTLSYADSTQRVSVNLANNEATEFEGGNDRMYGFERLVLGAGDDYVNGSILGDIVEGGAGNDEIFGDSGDDRLFGDSGDDRLIGGDGNDLLDGGVGADLMYGGDAGDTYVVDNIGDQVIENAGFGGDTVLASISYTLGSNLERLVLTGTSAINATGNDADNYLLGNAGRNILSGGAGGDIIATVAGNAAIKVGGGSDQVIGGSGFDTVMLGGAQSDYRLLSSGGRNFLVSSSGATEVSEVEQAGFFSPGFQSWSNVLATTTAFDAMSYIAGYSDLRAAFGTNAAAGAQHFIDYGFAEGRSLAFNALDYIASHSDLRAAFGTDVTAGAKHFIEYGAAEGRTTDFDGWAYLASYGDLIQFYGADEAGAAKHFIQYGAAEGRMASFDALAYAATYADVAAAFGTDKEALARHYVLYGYAEGRSPGVAATGAVTATTAGAVDAGGHDTVPASAFADATAGHVDGVKFTGESWFGEIGVPYNDMMVIA
ncbi:hypothetical protein ASE78_17795 [Sphingomonas sp. Leaf25]|nr:hypothetical protein ASE78_17795 [Sphingomonas sp. Leaf25]